MAQWSLESGGALAGEGMKAEVGGSVQWVSILEGCLQKGSKYPRLLVSRVVMMDGSEEF